jgi:hypothetical protein
MKIIEEPVVDYQINLSVKNAELIQDYKVKIKFSDNSQQIVDFEPFIRSSHHPDIKKYMDKERFKQFKIIDGNLNWNDYDMIFPVSDLKKGKIA